MAVNKNFVVKNGIEVAENLIFADSDLEKVGIGSTVPNDTLDVRGGIAATNFYAAGIVTSTDNFYVGASGTVFTALTGFGSVGVGTANPIFPLDIRSSASTGTTALYVYGDMRVTGDINLDDITLDDVNATDLNVSGLSTLTGNVVLAGSVNQLNVSGISTFSDDVIISGGGIQVTGVATFTDSIDANAGLDVDGQADLDEVVVAGVSSFSAYPSIDADNEIQVGTAIQLGKAGVITATSFSGSGANLTDVVSGISLQQAGSWVSTGTAATTFNFASGATLTNVDSGISTITISAGIQTVAFTTSNVVYDLDLSNYQDHKATVSGVTTFSCTGGTEGDSHTLRIVNSGVTTVGFSTYFLWPSGAMPSLPTTDGALSLISFTVHREGAVGLGTQLFAGASVDFS